MILQDIRQYLQQRGQATLYDIATHFDLDPEVARAMLQFWISKGRVRQLSQGDACGDSCHCDSRAQMDTFQWNPQIGHISIDVN